MTNLRVAALAEAAGTAALLAVVVGSGIMGERLAAGNAAVALLANSLATGCGLFVLISTLGPVSGAHFNPVVSALFWWRGEIAPARLVAYVLAQLAGAVIGVWLAHAMFDLPLLQTSVKIRASSGQWISEGVATVGLLATIVLGLRAHAKAVPALVAAYITAAYWFTASTSFANPAVTLARSFTDTFAGIRPADVSAFIVAQTVGLFVVAMLSRVLEPGTAAPHERSAHPLREL